MQVTPMTSRVAPAAGPAPIAPELLKFIGGGAGTTKTTSPTPQAPKSTW